MVVIMLLKMELMLSRLVLLMLMTITTTTTSTTFLTFRCLSLAPLFSQPATGGVHQWLQQKTKYFYKNVEKYFITQRAGILQVLLRKLNF